MSGPARHPLLQVLVDEFPQEDARHQQESPSAEVWMAQVDAFSAHLTARVVDTVAAEMRAALTASPSVLCLHRVIAAFSNLPEDLALLAAALTETLCAAEDAAEEEG